LRSDRRLDHQARPARRRGVPPGNQRVLYEWARLHRPPFQAVRVVGDQWSARSHELRDMLSRNGIPFGFYPVDLEEGRRLLDSVGVAGERLPVVVLFDGRVLVDPSNIALAEALDVQTHPEDVTYDVTVIGAGPAGLAAAVYGASEGLRTVVLEPEAAQDGLDLRAVAGRIWEAFRRR